MSFGMQPTVTTQPRVPGVTYLDPAHNIVYSKNGPAIQIQVSETSELIVDERPFPQNCKPHPAEFPITTAIAFNDARHVSEFFSNWRGHFLSSEHQTWMAKSLHQAAQLPPAKAKDIIRFLLNKLNPHFIERIDCLLDAATDATDKDHQGHSELIEYINKTFAYPYTAFALVDALSQKKLHRVRALLRAGVDPNRGIGTQHHPKVIIHDGDQQFTTVECKFGHYPLHMAAFLGESEMVSELLKHNASVVRVDHHKETPLFAALKGFSDKDTEPITQNRLYIVRRILEAMPAHMRPLPIQAESLNLTPSARGRVRNLFQSFLPQPPPQVRMVDKEVILTPEQLAELDRQLMPVAFGLSVICAGACICIFEKCCKKEDKEEEPKQKKAFILSAKQKRDVTTTQRRTK